jgi:hypothetical protein
MPVSERGGSLVRSPLPEPDATVWGQDTNWILQFDNVIKHPGGKCKGCHCDVHDRTRGLDSGTNLILFIAFTVEHTNALNCVVASSFSFVSFGLL